eukprot:1628725-Prymnesium_polylepis.1
MSREHAPRRARGKTVGSLGLNKHEMIGCARLHERTWPHPQRRPCGRQGKRAKVQNSMSSGFPLSPWPTESLRRYFHGAAL